MPTLTFRAVVSFCLVAVWPSLSRASSSLRALASLSVVSTARAELPACAWNVARSDWAVDSSEWSVDSSSESDSKLDWRRSRSERRLFSSTPILWETTYMHIK